MPVGDVNSTTGKGYSLWVKTAQTSGRMSAFGSGAESIAQHVHLNINQVASAGGGQLRVLQTETTQSSDDVVDVTDDSWHHVAINVTKTDGYSYDY